MNHQRRWSRRDFLSGATVAGTAAFLGLKSKSAAAEPPPETTRIRIHDAPITCFAPAFLAEELLKAEGFTDVQYVKTPLAEGPNQALAEGQVDFIQDDTAAHLMGLDKGLPILLLGGIHTGCWELFGNASVRSLRDLKGKTVAAPVKSSRQAFVAGMVASVGLDPNKDIVWISHEPGKSMKLFEEGKIDAFMGFAPEPQELRSKKIGHVILNTLTDRPWSQYFCCIAATNQEFARKHPVATKRALRAFVKAADLCVSNPERAARLMVDRGTAENYEYTLQSVKEIGYPKWREYDSEDTVRFWGLRLHEVGLIKTNPKKLIAKGTDWRFINELKRELKA
ncbi:MAG: ABC transporter substrate-binding protein [Pseudomonadota bacterium]|nr:ABC transporter substrate-binding protein [Pseudomonadota bacterium]